jgi:hypothetical protein
VGCEDLDFPWFRDVAGGVSVRNRAPVATRSGSRGSERYRREPVKGLGPRDGDARGAQAMATWIERFRLHSGPTSWDSENL